MPRTHLISDRRYLHDCEACSNIPSFPFVSPCLPENSVRKSPSYLYQTEELPDHTHIPDIVHRKFFIILSFFVKVCGTNQLIGLIEQLTSPIFLATYLDMLETAILIQRYRSVVEKIGIGNQIHSAIRKQATHMLLQLLAIHKRIVNLFHSSRSSSVSR